MQSGWRDCANSFGLLILRLGVGGFMATHGWGKLQTILEGKFDQFPDPIGIGSAPSLILVTVAEFACALLIMVGLGTRLAALPLVIAMGVAAFKFHADDPWSKKEPALMFLIPFLALVFTGAGKFSLDGLFWARRRPSQPPAA